MKWGVGPWPHTPFHSSIQQHLEIKQIHRTQGAIAWAMVAGKSLIQHGAG